MELVLVHPEIPHNTGCAARLAAATGLRLHLVEPLGFSLDDRHLKRAGLDYWPLVDLVVHTDWQAAVGALEQGSQRPLDERLRLFTARGGQSLFETTFEVDDVLCFGSESAGLPSGLLDGDPERRVYVPIRPGIRSLNLANVVCLAAYTALSSAGMSLPDNDGTYTARPAGAPRRRPADVARRQP
jgi:tRNA (cytidine/uridine-2'-O-)-methyltransferase